MGATRALDEGADTRGGGAGMLRATRGGGALDGAAHAEPDSCRRLLFCLGFVSRVQVDREPHCDATKQDATLLCWQDQNHAYYQITAASCTGFGHDQARHLCPSHHCLCWTAVRTSTHLAWEQSGLLTPRRTRCTLPSRSTPGPPCQGGGQGTQTPQQGSPRTQTCVTECR
jgi:hypothetical protein